MNLAEMRDEMYVDYKKQYVKKVADFIEDNFDAKVIKLRYGLAYEDFSGCSITIAYLGKQIQLNFSHSGKSLYVGKNGDMYDFKSEVLSVLFRKLENTIVKGGK